MKFAAHDLEPAFARQLIAETRPSLWKISHVPDAATGGAPRTETRFTVIRFAERGPVNRTIVPQLRWLKSNVAVSLSRLIEAVSQRTRLVSFL
ncbi:MAG: hypothetical protein WC804_00160 [Sphingomonas sp.]|jgi:hypothetical protein|uniref:hypothetical protein n=1 Tax=Sphingomonas sp. TaxID=28214 RepID=UPI003562C271